MINHIDIQVDLEDGEKWPEDVWEIHSLTTKQIANATSILVTKRVGNLVELRVMKDRFGIFS